MTGYHPIPGMNWSASLLKGSSTTDRQRPCVRLLHAVAISWRNIFPQYQATILMSFGMI